MWLCVCQHESVFPDGGLRANKDQGMTSSMEGGPHATQVKGTTPNPERLGSDRVHKPEEKKFGRRIVVKVKGFFFYSRCGQETDPRKRCRL